jgi:hypothetical protein
MVLTDKRAAIKQWAQGEGSSETVGRDTTGVKK